MGTVIELKSNLTERLRSLLDQLSELGLNSDSLDRLKKLIKKSEDHAFRLVVVGAFSRGKSTVINTMIGQAILKSGLKPTTAVPIELVRGDAYEFEVFDDAGEAIQTERGIQSLQSLVELVTAFGVQDNLHEGHKYRRIRVRLPLSEIPEGLVIVDTPGIASVIGEHDELTRTEVDSADGVLFVTAAEPILSVEELCFYQEHVRLAAGEKVLCVITKVDFIENEDDLSNIIAYVEKNIGLDRSRILSFSKDSKGVWENVRNQMLDTGPFQDKEKRLIQLVEHFKSDILGQVIFQENRGSNFSDSDLEAQIRTQTERRDNLKREVGVETERTSNLLKEIRKKGELNADALYKQFQNELKKAVNIEELDKAFQCFATAVATRLTEDRVTIATHVQKFEDCCEVVRKETDAMLMEIAGLKPKPKSGWLGAGLLGTGAAAAIGVAGAAIWPTTVATTTLFGSTALGSAATIVGLGALTTTTVAVAPVVAPIVGAAVVGGVITAWWWHSSQTTADVKASKEKIIAIGRQYLDEAKRIYSKLLEENLQIIEYAKGELILREENQLAVLTGNRDVLVARHFEKESKRLAGIRKVLEEFSLT